MADFYVTVVYTSANVNEKRGLLTLLVTGEDRHPEKDLTSGNFTVRDPHGVALPLALSRSSTPERGFYTFTFPLTAQMLIVLHTLSLELAVRVTTSDGRQAKATARIYKTPGE